MRSRGQVRPRELLQRQHQRLCTLGGRLDGWSPKKWGVWSSEARWNQFLIDFWPFSSIAVKQKNIFYAKKNSSSTTSQEQRFLVGSFSLDKLRLVKCWRRHLGGVRRLAEAFKWCWLRFYLRRLCWRWEMEGMELEGMELEGMELEGKERKEGQQTNRQTDKQTNRQHLYPVRRAGLA